MQVAETDIAAEFSELYGRKVVIRHIQVATATDAQGLLRSLEQGANFISLAEQYSLHPSAGDGGLLGPVGEHTVTVPPALRQAALAMDRPGQVAGPVQVGTTYHLLYLEEVRPARQVQLTEVRSEVEASARRRLTQLASTELLRRLVAQARIDYVDPVLKEHAAGAGM